MRVIKQNTLSYEAFHKSLPNMTRTGTTGGGLKLIHYNPGFDKNSNQNKYNKLTKLIYSFNEKIKNINDLVQIVGEFKSTLKNIIEVKEADILLFDEQQKSLKGFHNKVSSNSKQILGKSATFEILAEIFKNGGVKIISEKIVSNNDLKTSSCFLIPAVCASKKKVLLSVITNSTSLKENSTEIVISQLALQSLLGRIDSITKQKEIISAYEELQVYQSKLANDFKLSAIGELTTGIADEILSPMQVIASYSEFLKKDNSSYDEKIVDTILHQVKKVKDVVNRLVEFSGTNDVKSRVQSCNINNILSGFYNMVNSTLTNYNYECILDLDEKIPPMLSNPNELTQMMTNVFSFLFNKNNKPAGLIIQTRFQTGNIIIKFLCTNNINETEDERQKTSKQLNLKIVKNLVDKHHGEVSIDSDRNSGTILQLLFPLRRKVS